jgi:hypothetical protein
MLANLEPVRRIWEGLNFDESLDGGPTNGGSTNSPLQEVRRGPGLVKVQKRDPAGPEESIFQSTSLKGVDCYTLQIVLIFLEKSTLFWFPQREIRSQISVLKRIALDFACGYIKYEI